MDGCVRVGTPTNLARILHLEHLSLNREPESDMEYLDLSYMKKVGMRICVSNDGAEGRLILFKLDCTCTWGSSAANKGPQGESHGCVRRDCTYTYSTVCTVLRMYLTYLYAICIRRLCRRAEFRISKEK
jgi:hypothetical protein